MDDIITEQNKNIFYNYMCVCVCSNIIIFLLREKKKRVVTATVKTISLKFYSSRPVQ